MPDSPFPPTSGTDLLIAPGTQALPPFPTWPPPSGGAPFPGTEQGPILNPYPYGSPQGANISIANPAPPFNATFFPHRIPPRNGQNQSPPAGWPAWPHARFNTLPDKASPSISAIHPPPLLGPGPGLPPREAGISSPSQPARTFPAGSYIDGYGNLITPSAVKVVGSGTSTP